MILPNGVRKHYVILVKAMALSPFFLDLQISQYLNGKFYEGNIFESLNVLVPRFSVEFK